MIRHCGETFCFLALYALSALQLCFLHCCAPMLSKINEARQHFIQALDTGDFEHFAAYWYKFSRETLSIANSGLLQGDELAALAALFRGVSIILTGTEALRCRTEADIEQAENQVRQYLKLQGPTMWRRHSIPPPTPPKAKPQLASHHLTDSLKNKFSHDDTPYRQFFLSNLAWPFVDPASRSVLVSQSGGTPTQVMTWFINARRRSGWGDLYKLYGGSTKTGMDKFVKQCESPTSRWQICEEARDRLDKVKAWLMTEKSFVRDGIREVVAQASEIKEEVRREMAADESSNDVERKDNKAVMRVRRKSAEQQLEDQLADIQVGDIDTNSPDFFALPPIQSLELPVSVPGRLSPTSSPYDTSSIDNMSPARQPAQQQSFSLFDLSAMHLPAFANEPRSHFSLDSTSTFFASQSPTMARMPMYGFAAQ